MHCLVMINEAFESRLAYIIQFMVRAQVHLTGLLARSFFFLSLKESQLSNMNDLVYIFSPSKSQRGKE